MFFCNQGAGVGGARAPSTPPVDPPQIHMTVD